MLKLLLCRGRWSGGGVGVGMESHCEPISPGGEWINFIPSQGIDDIPGGTGLTNVHATGGVHGHPHY